MKTGATMRYTSDLSPSGTKGLWYPHQASRGVEMDHPKYLKNDKRYKSETLGGVRGILQGLKQCQVDIIAFAW